jgi:hypothetical protein
MGGILDEYFVEAQSGYHEGPLAFIRLLLQNLEVAVYS